MNLLFPLLYTIVFYCTLPSATKILHGFFYVQMQFCVCVCVHVCVLDVHAHVCMCISMYVCDSYNTQNGIETIGGLLYFNNLSTFVYLLYSLFY